MADEYGIVREREDTGEIAELTGRRFGKGGERKWFSIHWRLEKGVRGISGRVEMGEMEAFGGEDAAGRGNVGGDFLSRVEVGVEPGEEDELGEDALGEGWAFTGVRMAGEGRMGAVSGGDGDPAVWRRRRRPVAAEGAA